MYPGAYVGDAPDRPAVIMAGSGWVQTYAELDAAANQLSRVLHDAGLRPGDHVALCMENHPRYLEALWGCRYAGLIYTACSSRLTPGELSYIVNDCGAKAVIVSAAMAPAATALLASTPDVHLRLAIGGDVEGHDSYEAALAAQPPTPLPDRVAGTDMLYSSGTTGQPKGVMPAFVPQPLETSGGSIFGLLTMLFGFQPGDVYLTPAPLYHAAPLRFTMAVHVLGGTAVVMEHFSPEAFLAAIEQHRVTHTQVVPTMFVRLLKLDGRERYDVSSVKAIIHAAAPCPVPVKRAIIEWFGPVVHEYYAGTEGNGFVYCNSEQWLAHPGTVGTPLGCVIHIVGEDGSELPTGETGTVYFEGGASFEYHNDPDKTRSSRHPLGWSTLGDVGYVDADGFLYLTDRKAYMIISGGVNIYPQEAENVLVTHPKVLDAAVFGIPDPDFGEQVKAVVQPVAMPSAEGDAEALEQELIEFCRSQLAHLKCPRSIDFRAELPRHPTGKLYKRILRDEYWAAAAGPA
jgi:long-chain acyl-CoA synthetase